MSTEQAAPNEERRLSPADVQNVRFNRGSVMRPGYAEVEVDRFLARVAQELSRSMTERAELRDQVHALREQLSGVQRQQAVQEPRATRRCGSSPRRSSPRTTTSRRPRSSAGR